jgi:hypothetical protein
MPKSWIITPPSRPGPEIRPRRSSPSTRSSSQLTAMRRTRSIPHSDRVTNTIATMAMSSPASRPMAM